MAEIEIYSSPFCGYCRRAKQLLASKGIAFREIDLLAEPDRRDEMTARSGGRVSVPQIFVNGRHIGDSHEIAALDRAGKLDALLRGD